MSNSQMTPALRDEILAQPAALLDDSDVMSALITAHARGMGKNVVDLRGVAMDRMEERLDRLEETHKTVIAAAYENLAGTNQVHRAILRMLDAAQFDEFLRNLADDVAPILRVDFLMLVVESTARRDAAFDQLGDVLQIVPPGFVQDYLSRSRAGHDRVVTLRPVPGAAEDIYGAGHSMRSEACLRLDFGTGKLPGMLVMSATDPSQFAPNQGTDLLGFFAGVFERSMRRWLT
ncbi:MAG: DUF484 family protein [Pseudomonadota bacterium]